MIPSQKIYIGKKIVTHIVSLLNQRLEMSKTILSADCRKLVEQ